MENNLNNFGLSDDEILHPQFVMMKTVMTQQRRL